jgi:hypothetical protein
MYRTVTGHPCHAYSRDGGRTWTPTAYATYTPGGRLFKHPRACPRIWKAGNGKFLFWYHNHGGTDFSQRNPGWLAGGIERNGAIHWSQPEILLYDPDIEKRISYPDLIEENGRYWVTATQKEIARVHELDPALLEGLWQQGSVKTVSAQGLVLSLGPDALQGGSADMPRLPNLREGRGFSIDLWLQMSDLSAGQLLLDARDKAGKGLMLTTTDTGAIQIDLSDGRTRAVWDCDPGILDLNQRHHVVVTVDGGPKIITFLVDGVLCDGGTARQYGWGRFSDALGDVNGSGRLRIAPRFRGELEVLRIYDRYLRTSEAVAHHLAGVQ